jgi:two-component system response regulator FlrC
MRILIIGNLEGHFLSSSVIARKKGASVTHCENIDDGISLFRSGKSADLILIDVKSQVPYFIAALRRELIQVPVIACGVGVNTELAVAAIEAGAKDYIDLPPDEEIIANLIESISSNKKDMIFESSLMSKIVETSLKIAPTNVNVLITGPSGTGKEVMARFIHDHSKRNKNNFVSINCASISENLLESEFFGHEKGSFTGAIARRIGKFEESCGGTILLDEISEIEPRLQAKLLRAIQEREICRVGGNELIKLDLRIIATSNKNLYQEVAAGRFREDLFYRLNIINLELPRLAERKEDIIPLVRFFVDKYSKLNGMESKSLSEEALEKLARYQWPGNIRELENTIYRAVLLSSENKINADDLMINEQAGNQENNMFDSNLKDEIAAANLLGLSLKRLKSKLDRLNMPRVNEELGGGL